MSDEHFKQLDIDALLRGVDQFTPLKVAVPTRMVEARSTESETERQLTEAIYHEGTKRVAGGADSLALKRGMDRAVKEVTQAMKGLSTKVDGDLIERVTIRSAKGDAEIGRMIAKAIARVGRKGLITVEETSANETSLDVQTCLRLERGDLSPYFVTDATRMQVVLNKPMVLLYEGRLSTTADVLPALQFASAFDRPLLIVAEEVEGEALATLVINVLNGTARVAAVSVPGDTTARKSMLENLAKLTGGKVISDHDLNEKRLAAALGWAERVVVGRDETSIIADGGHGPATEPIAMIKVGGLSEEDVREQKARIDEAMAVTQAAVDEGIVPGAGVALFLAGRALDKLKLSGDEMEGVTIIKRAIEAPYRAKAGQRGLRESQIGIGGDEQLVADTDAGYMLDAGIFHATKDLRTALESANTVAGQLLTTQALNTRSLGKRVEPTRARGLKPWIPVDRSSVIARAALERAPASEAVPASPPPPGQAPLPVSERGDTKLVPFERTPHMAIADGAKAPGESFTVEIYADQYAPLPGENSTSIKMYVPDDLPFIDVDVWLTGTRHFDFAERQALLRIPIQKDERSGVVQFTVKVTAAAEKIPGTPSLAAYFSYQQRPCGQVSRDVEIRSARAEAEESPKDPPKPRMRIDVKAAPADLNIHVIDRDRRQQRLEVRVQSPHLELPNEYVSWPLPLRTADFVSAIMGSFVAAKSCREAIDALIGAGELFWKAAPDNLRDAYWLMVDRGLPLQTISVVSQESYYPWELARPHRGKQALQPLGVAHAVGRWIDGESVSPPQHVCINASLIVAPKYDGTAVKPLPFAEEEAKYVFQKVNGRTLAPVGYDDFAEALVKKDYDLLHVACHAAADAAPGIQTIHLENGAKLTSLQISGINKAHNGFGRDPVIFFNCCEIGRPTPSLVGIDGFAKAFIDAGAAAVIAPLWSVKDNVAHDVCTSFYEALEKWPDLSLAAVMKTIRARAYQNGCGEDTYAAYTFYGDPNAIRVPTS
jgi:chaperonin GroEL